MNITTDTRKMLQLMSQVILADGHIYDSEIEALVGGASQLGLTDLSGQALETDQIRAWFNAYLQELNENWSAENKDIVLTRLILSLAEWPDKQAVLNTLIKISLADDSFHLEEKTLISIVKAYWQYDGLDAPGSKIIKA